MCPDALIAGPYPGSVSLRMSCWWLQALPSGAETDFILVGCAGVQTGFGDGTQLEKLISAKRKGMLCMPCCSKAVFAFGHTALF